MKATGLLSRKRDEPDNVIYYDEPERTERPEPRRRNNGLPGQDIHRALPFSEEAEQGALCSILTDSKLLFEAERIISENSFHKPANRIIWNAIREAREFEGAWDLITITQYLRDSAQLEAAGGPAYVTSLFTYTATSANFTYYADILREKQVLRDIISTCTEAASEAFTGKPVDIITALQEKVQSFSYITRNGGLPEMVDMRFRTGEQKSPKPPELVKGVLHRGNKIILGGTSKGRKTFSLMDLAISVATGADWWGFPCEQGRVCYINFEIQQPFFEQRYEDICSKKGVWPDPKQFMAWTLRGHVSGIEKMSDQIIRHLQNHDFSLIVVDPIYKALGDRDENKAGDVASLCNELEKIAVKTGAAIAFGAHYSKGNQAAKDSMDRIGGSGVFARDPDSILTMTAHEEEECFIVEMTLRNIPPTEPFVVKWQWPLFQRVDGRDPQNFKKPRKVDRAGQFEQKYNAVQIIDLLASEPNVGRKTTEIKKFAMDELGMSKGTFFNLWPAVQESPRITKRKDNRYYVVF